MIKRQENDESEVALKDACHKQVQVTGAALLFDTSDNEVDQRYLFPAYCRELTLAYVRCQLGCHRLSLNAPAMKRSPFSR